MLRSVETDEGWEAKRYGITITKRRRAIENVSSIALRLLKVRVEEALRKVTAEDCRKAVQHCINLEDSYTSYQLTEDSEIRPVIINITDDDSEDEDSESEDHDAIPQPRSKNPDRPERWHSRLRPKTRRHRGIAVVY